MKVLIAQIKYTRKEMLNQLKDHYKKWEYKKENVRNR